VGIEFRFDGGKHMKRLELFLLLICLNGCGGGDGGGQAVSEVGGITARAGLERVFLSWNLSSSNADGYLVYWNNRGAVTSQDGVIDAGETAAYMHGPIRETTYYRIAAVSKGTIGPLSAEISATPRVVTADWYKVFPELTERDLNAAAHGRDRLVVVGNQIIMTMRDEVDWQEVDLVRHHLRDVVWNGSLFVAVGLSGAILTSSDGLQWHEESSGAVEDLERIIWGGDRFYVSGSMESVLESRDGVIWSRNEDGLIGTGVKFSAIVWAGDRLVAFRAGVHPYYQHVYLYSPAEATWSEPTLISYGGFIADAAWNGNKIVAVGSYVFESVNLTDWVL